MIIIIIILLMYLFIEWLIDSLGKFHKSQAFVQKLCRFPIWNKEHL